MKNEDSVNFVVQKAQAGIIKEYEAELSLLRGETEVLDRSHKDLGHRLAEAARENERKDAELAKLRKVLNDIAEYCSGDGLPLGAIERLASIRNIAYRAALTDEQLTKDSQGDTLGPNDFETGPRKW